jgi:hypothetical protein
MAWDDLRKGIINFLDVFIEEPKKKSNKNRKPKKYSRKRKNSSIYLNYHETNLKIEVDEQFIWDLVEELEKID